MKDLVIIGAGPAGISAALYTARGNIATQIVAAGDGALARAEKIANYYGAADNPSGAELLARGHAQVEALGVPIERDEIVDIQWNGEHFTVAGKRQSYEARAVLLATGASRPAPRIANLQALEGKGVSYCAVCDGFFYRNKTVAVIGAGAYCLHEASVLAKLAQTCYVLTDGQTPELEFPESFRVITTPIRQLDGTDRLSGVTFEDGTQIAVDGAFVAIAQASAADFARKIGVHCPSNAIATDDNKMTNLPGLFAAGDCTGGLLQVCKAVSDGAIAATGIRKFLSGKL